MRTIDWSRTPVGPVETWPQSLRTALSILLKQKTAVFIFWGSEHVQFYNDAYRPILGTKKHPAAMGQRGAECWPEIWEVVRPLVEAVHQGESTAVEDGLLVIDRNGYLEEGYYTYTYSPIAEECGAVGGVFCVVYDTTDRVIGDRRLRTLRELANLTVVSDPEAACRAAAATLAGNPHDVPFAGLYLYGHDRSFARLAAVTGSEAGSAATPQRIEFQGEALSVIASAASVSRVREIPDLASQAGPLPGGSWPVGAESGVVLPLAAPGRSQAAGFLLVGVSPRKKLDASYRTFFELAAGQIGGAIAEAEARHEERQRAEALADLDRAKTWLRREPGETLDDVRLQAERAALLLGSIVDSSDDAIISKDLNGIITSWNGAAERLFGYKASEVVGRSITVLIPEDRLAEEPEILRRLQRGERVDHFETVRKRKDGTLLNISVTISPVRDARGNITGASKIARDITERKRSEEAIQMLNARLKSELTAVARMQRLSTRLVRSGDFSLLLGDIIEAGVEITRALAGKVQLFEEGTLKTVAFRGGEEHAETSLDETLDQMAKGHLQATPLLSRSGQVLGLFTTKYRPHEKPGERELRMLDVLGRQAADLIERSHAEEALRQSEARFRELADAGPQCIWVCSPDGGVEYVNQQWVEYSGLDLDVTTRIEGLAVTAHPADYDEMMKRWRDSVSTGATLDIEVRLRRADGVYRWFVIRSAVVRDDEHRIVKWLGSCTDIHERKLMEDELRQVNRDLEQFAYSASHDLQEPLRSVKIYGELLAARYRDRLDGQALEFLSYLRGGANRMEELIRNLLAYTQVTKIEVPGESTDANQALAETLANLRQAIDSSAAQITADELPAIRIHSSHLTQLLQNLIGNAIKYRSPGRTAEIHVSARRAPEQWIFSVKDNGIGIEPEYKERIFGLFKRLHTGDEYAGTGIGLAICQRIVERYGGRIWVESEPGKGSIFLFSLPG